MKASWDMGGREALWRHPLAVGAQKPSSDLGKHYCESFEYECFLGWNPGNSAMLTIRHDNLLSAAWNVRMAKSFLFLDVFPSPHTHPWAVGQTGFDGRSACVWYESNE